MSCAAGVPSRAAATEAAPHTGTIYTVTLPGGVEGIRQAVGDRRATPPATVIVELTRRVHGGTEEAVSSDPVRARLRQWLRECLRADDCGAPQLAADRVPLPGPPALWLDVVFERLVPEARLVPAILDRRDTALLYTALLSMREDVRAWILGRPALIRQLRGPDAGPLLIAAPYLRLDGERWRLPGGADASPVWTALAGGPAASSESWLLAFLRAHDGRLAYLAEVVETLPRPQQRAILALDAPDPARRVAAGLDLLDGVRAATDGWDPRVRSFWRPAFDPGFLLAQMRIGEPGRLAVPGGRHFWTLIFADGPVATRPAAARAAWDSPAPVTAGVLLPAIWLSPPAEQAIRYEQALFASRRLTDAVAGQAADVATILRGYGRFPQLLRVLDRLDVGDVPRLAALVRRADTLREGGADWRRQGAAIRWQCTIGFLDYMARLGALERDELLRALDALAVDAATPPSRGTQVRALLAALGVGAVAGDHPARAVEDALVARLTRSRIGIGRRVTWEDQAYRLDIGAAERDRIGRVRGRDALARLDGAWAIYALSDAAVAPAGADVAAQLARVVEATRLDRVPALDDRFGLEARRAAGDVWRLLERDRARRDWGAIRDALDDLGDALATDAFAELAYAVNLGWAEELPLTALAAFRRHVFTRPSIAGPIDASWLAPEITTGRRDAWHVVGSLLGLGEALAPVTLRRPSLKPLAAAPSLNTGNRRWLVTTTAGFDRRAFSDDAQRALVAAVERGEARVRATTGAAAAAVLADAAGVPPMRQAVAAWLGEVTPPALRGLFSLVEIVRLGSDGGPLPAALAAWGVAQPPVTGRLGAGPLPAWPWERYAGRSSRLVSCALPDLPLTLAVRLAALDLPAMLVPDLMPSATYELVNLASPRHVDDADAIVEHVRSMDQAALERHLGLLTTGGPLRPVTAGSR